MKKGAIVQIFVMLVTITVCVLGVVVAILSTKEDTILTQEEILDLPQNNFESDALVSPDDLISTDFDTSSNTVFDETLLSDELEQTDETLEDDVIETTPIQPSSTYTSSYDGALISLTQEDVTYLDDYLWGFGEDVAVYFYDIHSKVEYIYNPDQKFSLASVIKAPYCMYVYELATQGLVDLEQVILYEERHLAEGTGDIKLEEFGAPYTVEELIGIAIKRSDNTAIEMLRDVAPLNNFIEYIKATYAIDHPEDISWALNTATDVKDIGAYALGIFEFIEVNPFGDNLKEYMINSRNKLLYLPYDVAHKYGWTLEAFNDMAIVYADNPYILVICSKRVDGTDDDYKMFSSIGSIVNNLQAKKYGEV